MNRISFNVNGQAIHDKAKLETFLRAYQPSTLLIMQQPDYAVYLHTLLGGKTKIVSRMWTALEGDEYHIPPLEWVNQQTGWGFPEIYRYALNEPPTGSQLQNVIGWLVEVMTLLSDRGYKGVIGNFSVGSYEMSDVESGVFDPLLRTLAGSEHYFGLHEYTGICLPYGVGQWPVSWLEERERVQPQNWPKRHQLPFRRWDDTLPPYWHLLRSAWFDIRCEELGIQKPRYWISEFGWDALPDMSALQPNVYETLKNRFGVPSPYVGIRCLNTLENVWRYYWPEWSKDRAAYEQLAWANSLYPAHYEGFNLFTWSDDYGWKNDFGCDYAELDELHSLLLANPTPAPVEPGCLPLLLSLFKR